MYQQKRSACCVETIVNSFATNGGKCKTLATLTNGGAGGSVNLTEWKDEKKELYHWEALDKNNISLRNASGPLQR
eukprot:5268760-Ditylum_brightwellii.AAC.1